MASADGAAAEHPALLRLLGTMTGDWRSAHTDVLSYLSAQARAGQDGLPAVVAELDLLLPVASEFDCVQLVIESGAHFSPYGEFTTAAAFLRDLRGRLAAVADAPPATAPPAAAQPAPPQLTYPLVRRVLRPLWSRWRDASDDVYLIDYLGAVVCDLVDLVGVAPGAVVAEIDQLLAARLSAGEHAAFLAELGVHDVVAADAERFWRELRGHVAGLAERYPRPDLDPAGVTATTVAALDGGVFARAMTGLVRRYGLPELRGGDLAHFRATVATLLDQVLPQWVERYVDDLCYTAQTVTDDIDWTRARWMRSAVELLVTEYGQTDAAGFVDVDQLALVDGLLAAPTGRFQPPPGAVAPRLPASHWWWQAEPAGPGIGRLGLPAYLRWYRGLAAWQARPTPADDAGATAAALAKELSTRMIRAGLNGLGPVFRPQSATVTVQALDRSGLAVGVAGPVLARVRGERLVVPDTQLSVPDGGERVITSATVRGAVGEAPASWSAELVRVRQADKETTAWGWAALVLDGALGTHEDTELAAALHDWEDELEAPISDWVSADRPTLVGRYGQARETVAHDLPRPYPLLTGISKHLWDGDPLPGLAGIARAYAGELFKQVPSRPWETDWVAALQFLGADGWDEFLGRLVRWPRELTGDEWYLLCAARSGMQLLAEELAEAPLAGLLRPGRIRTLDDAMRTFGHTFGPIPLTDVPTRLHRRHKWWRYPAGTPDVTASCTLQQLVLAIRTELDLAQKARTTGASDDALQRVLHGCERVLDGSLTGFRGSDAATVCRLVTDGWRADADLTAMALGYFLPIKHHDTLWTLPPDPS
ncbi:MAG: hypothetical protein GEV07_29040 [Streptosporangiales bacterium]|nr:hypothetical protein [Streptosporangiales bacterium]